MHSPDRSRQYPTPRPSIHEHCDPFEHALLTGFADEAIRQHRRAKACGWDDIAAAFLSAAKAAADRTVEIHL